MQDPTPYVTLQGEDKIAIIDVENLELMDSISVEKLPHNLDLSPDDRYLYTANIGTSDVAVIDLESKEIIKRIKVSAGHHGIDVTNDGKRVYVSGIGSDKINVIDAESLELIKQIDVGQGPHGIRASEDDSKVYVGVTTTNEILVIDSDSLEVEDKIQTGKIPFWLAVPQNPKHEKFFRYCITEILCLQRRNNFVVIVLKTSVCWIVRFAIQRKIKYVVVKIRILVLTVSVWKQQTT